MANRWLKRKDGTDVFRIGRYNALEIYKRPHGGYCCRVIFQGNIIRSEGYHGTSLPKKYHAVRYGMAELRTLQML